MKYTSFTCRLDEELLLRVDGYSKARGLTRIEVIRSAIDTFMRSPGATPANAYRMAQTTEYMQVVADIIISREMPEKRDAILATVAQRLEQYHGSR